MGIGLEMDSICKAIGGIPILENVSFSVRPGEFHLIVGENGAGKSVLVQILCGLTKKDSGTVSIDGSAVGINSPADAIRHGISFMQQDVSLFESMTVSENIFVCQRAARMESFGLVNFRRMNEEAQKLLDNFGFRLQSTQKVQALSLAQKRMVEITRLSLAVPKILVLDEPFSGIGDHERKVLLNLARKYQKKGTAVLCVSQQISILQKYVDRITVLKDGHVLVSENVDRLSDPKINRMIWGHFFPDKYPKLEIERGPEIFRVENLCSGRQLKNIDFDIDQGEILGITGRVGSGCSSLAKTIFGLTPARSGTFYVNQCQTEIRSPRDAISSGLAYITDDRYSEGMFLNLNILQNVFSIQMTERKHLMSSEDGMTRIYREYEKMLNLEEENPRKAIRKLSGGMQQKTLLMRWLLTDARLFIFNEPTNGVDIPSKVDIYNLMNGLVRKGAAIIIISSDVEALAGMCDRILVMKNGRIIYEAKRGIQGEYEDIYRHIL